MIKLNNTPGFCITAGVVEKMEDSTAELENWVDSLSNFSFMEEDDSQNEIYSLCLQFEKLKSAWVNMGESLEQIETKYKFIVGTYYLFQQTGFRPGDIVKVCKKMKSNGLADVETGKIIKPNEDFSNWLWVKQKKKDDSYFKNLSEMPKGIDYKVIPYGNNSSVSRMVEPF